jgi:2-succinyl-6-hydroxy-2,4-cyclohexadiene-1-carboxylate synthase
MKLTTTRWGRGETKALFLHGFTGSGRSFDHLEPLLGEVLTATCVELPGHGQTPPASWAETVQSIEALITDRTVLVGYSQGARLALAVAAKSPERVERLVLESCSPGLRRRHDRVLRRRSDETLAHALDSSGVDAFVDRWEALPIFGGLRSLPAAERNARAPRTPRADFVDHRRERREVHAAGSPDGDGSSDGVESVVQRCRSCAPSGVFGGVRGRADLFPRAPVVG